MIAGPAKSGVSAWVTVHAWRIAATTEIALRRGIRLSIVVSLSLNVPPAAAPIESHRAILRELAVIVTEA